MKKQLLNGSVGVKKDMIFASEIFPGKLATQIFFWELFTPKTLGFMIPNLTVADFLETFSWMGGLGGDPKNKMFRDAHYRCIDFFVFTPKVSGNVLPNEKPNISHFTSI